MSIDAIFANFDASAVQPQTPRGLIEPGFYQVVIAKSTHKLNKAGTGSYLELELQIVDGPESGRRIWDRLNLDNPNETAVEIAKASLSAICHAVGVLTPQSPEDLHDIPLEANIAIQPAKGEYSESNVVRGYRAIETAQVVKATPKRSTAKPAPKLSEPDDDLPF
jgi:hypothetical protein